MDYDADLPPHIHRHHYPELWIRAPWDLLDRMDEVGRQQFEFAQKRKLKDRIRGDGGTLENARQGLRGQGVAALWLGAPEPVFGMHFRQPDLLNCIGVRTRANWALQLFLFEGETHKRPTPFHLLVTQMLPPIYVIRGWTTRAQIFEQLPEEKPGYTTRLHCFPTKELNPPHTLRDIALERTNLQPPVSVRDP